jgi:hypothetical protein
VRTAVFLLDLIQYNERLLPAYRAALGRSSERALLLQLLDEAKQIASVSRKTGDESLWPDEVYDEHRRILGDWPSRASTERSGKSLEEFVTDPVGPELLEAICLPRDLGLSPEQSMSEPDLMDYLYQRSHWIEDMFTSVLEPTGPDLQVKLGEWSRLFSQDETMKFRSEVSAILPHAQPTEVVEGFSNLQRILALAAENPRFALAYCVR